MKHHSECPLNTGTSPVSESLGGDAASIAACYGLPCCWSADIDREVAKLPSSPKPSRADRARLDLRELFLITIDGEDAKDFDDAVYCQPQANGWRLLVAIADVSHYVKPGSPLDLAAYERGTSVYFPDRVLPMLPARLSNDLCSLVPNKDRLCLACDMQFDTEGKLLEYQFYPGLMRSKARLTYTEAARLIEQPLAKPSGETAERARLLKHLHQLGSKLREQRLIAGAVEFELPEAQIQFSDTGICNILRQPRTAAHCLIEDCMLAANCCAADYLHAQYPQAAMFRNHPQPSPSDLPELRRALDNFGLSLHGSGAPRARDYANLLCAAKTRSETRQAVQMLLLRTFGRAKYEQTPTGHFALACDFYTHFTSPIRRYPDLLVHRLIHQALSSPPGPPETVGSLQQAAEHCSLTERRAERACREAVARLKARFMQDKLGETFDAVITGVCEFGVFVTLQQIFVDGLVHISQLGRDYFVFEPDRLRLVGERSGRAYGFGDQLRVRLCRVDISAGKLDFVPEAASEYRPPRRHRRMH